MNMIVRNPFREMEDILERYTRTNRPLMEPDTDISVPDWSPTVDIEENDDAYTIKAEMPGVNKDDMEVNFDNGILTIKGEKSEEKTEDKGKIHRTECSYGSFSRSFTLPEGIKEDKINASYKDGILLLTVPKAEEKKPRSIAVDIH